HPGEPLRLVHHGIGADKWPTTERTGGGSDGVDRSYSEVDRSVAAEYERRYRLTGTHAVTGVTATPDSMKLLMFSTTSSAIAVRVSTVAVPEWGESTTLGRLIISSGTFGSWVKTSRPAFRRPLLSSATRAGS